MKFLTKNLWTIFEVAREERTDGDSFVGDMSVADDLFLAGLIGKKDCNYQCLDGLDKPALLAQWEGEDKPAAKAEYRALVIGDPDHRSADRYKELCVAFTMGDQRGFELAVHSGLAALEA